MTVTAVAALVFAVGKHPLPQGVFAGFLVALSSTAIVMKIIQERGEVDSPQGRNALGILIFQDLIIIPMILFVPFLAGAGEGAAGAQAAFLLLKAALVLGAVIFASRRAVPFLLDQVTHLRNRELFLVAKEERNALQVLRALYTAGIGVSSAQRAYGGFSPRAKVVFG